MPKQPDSTILDIAALLKLSPATISRALNNHPYVKEHTRKLVVEAAEKLGYRRNILASGLRNRKTNTIGMIVPRISMFFHAAVITAVQTALYNHGYQLIISQSNDDPALEKELLETFHASRVEAVLVACCLQTTDFSVFDKLSNNGTPVLFYDRVPGADAAVNMVRGDDVRGGYLAGSHLVETGCKRIAHISGPVSSNLYRDRKKGFLQAMEQHGVPVRETWIFHHDLTYANARATLEKLFSGTEVPDGIFTANDVTALAVLEFAKEKGIAVPGALKIVGYSNDPRSAIVSPAITTIEQFPEQVGVMAGETLLELLDKNTGHYQQVHKEVITPVQLIRRMST